MAKKKHSENPEWLWPAVIVGIVLLILLFNVVDLSSTNSKTEEYIYRDDSVYETNVVNDVRETNTETYCFNGECYTTQTEYNSAVKTYEDNQAYEKASDKWEEHRDILNNDAEKTNDAVSSYCNNIDMTGVPNCVNIAYPRLEVYANHIVNGQNFLVNSGDVFSNKQKLLADLDEQVIYVKTVANTLDSMVNNYNAWVLQQQNQQAQSQQEAEALSNILKILAMAI